MIATQATNLQTILDWIDQIKLKKAEANPHPVAACDDHEKEVYARMLACILLGGEGITEGQARVFQLILNALDLSDRRARIFEEASQPDRVFVEEFVEQASKQGWAEGFLVDGMVLCRLEQPLTEQQDQLFTEMAALLGVHNHRLPELVSVAAIVLGLPEPSPLKRNFDFRPFGFWEEFLYRELTLEHLRDGVNNGFWRIDQPLVTDFSWDMVGARIRFGELGFLVCHGSSCEIRIHSSHLSDPRIFIYKTKRADFQSVSVEGIYPQAAEQTALIVNDCEELSIADSEFKTIGARALCIHTSRYPSIENTIFNSCGSHNLIGGAIKITGEYRSHVTIRGCKFHKCIGLIGGGIYARYHYKLSFSDFIDCTSLAFPRSENVENDSLGRGSALFAEETIESEAVLRCRFEECDLNLGTITASCASSICRGSIFKGSHAAYLSRRDSDCRFLENTFEPEKPGVVQITIMTESVLADYVEEYHDVLHDLLQEYLKWNKNRSGLFQQYLKKIESQSENGIQDDEPKLAGLNIFQRQLSAILNEKEKKSQQNCTK